MRILADTNILISALLNPHGNSAQVLTNISEQHTLVLTDINISELHDVTERKFPDKRAAVDTLLANLDFELVVAPISPLKIIADAKDAPILNAAIAEDLDMIVSGDAHFLALSLSKPVILSPAQYLGKMRL